MKSMNKNFTAIFVMGIVLAGTMSQAEAANTVWDDQQITNIVNDHQDQITQNNADSINRDSATDNRLTQVNDDLQSTKLGVLVVDKMANDAHQKALLAGALADTASLKSETALQGVATNGTAIINLQHVDNIQDSRLTALENAPKPINGADGAKGDKGDTGATGAKGDKGDTGATGAKGDKGDTGVTGAKGEKGDAGATGMKGDKGDTGAQGIAGRNGRDGADGHNGKDGVTTTVTQRQLDTATQAKVAKNSLAVTAATQDLQATRQSLQAMNTITPASNLNLCVMKWTRIRSRLMPVFQGRWRWRVCHKCKPISASCSLLVVRLTTVRARLLSVRPLTLIPMSSRK